ncbi:MAG: hypothetical protein J0651_02125, partial [Actinobacteria bacterium]|nr:hypothetical protein [Actinomycetota bacterium]
RLYLNSTSFAHNPAGALALATAAADITNCTFAFNTATSGGAIYWTLSPPRLIHNLYYGNRALYGPITGSPLHHLIYFHNSSLTLTSGQT